MADRENMLVVCLHCDSTDLFTKEECDIDNLCELRFPELIVREWYEKNLEEFNEETAQDLKIPVAEATFDKWFDDVYVASDTDGLYAFAKEKGFQARREMI